MKHERNARATSDCSCDSGAAGSDDPAFAAPTSARSGTSITDSGETTLLSGSITVNSSVDVSRNDTGYLACMERNHSAAVNVATASHATSEEAFLNLRSGASDVSILAGHGMSGILVTGTGRIISTSDAYMAITTETDWGPFANLGVAGRRLVLFGCRVAAAPGGAVFMNDVVRHTGGEVGAWTGDVWCLGSDIFGEGQFIVATRDKPAPEIDPPLMFSSSGPQLPLHIRNPTGYDVVDPSQVILVNFTPIGNLPGQVNGGNTAQPGANAIVKEVKFHSPVEKFGRLGAILNGQLTIFYKDASSGTKSRTFLVLAFSVLQDVCFPTVYYYASPHFRRQIENAAYT